MDVHPLPLRLVEQAEQQHRVSLKGARTIDSQPIAIDF
jgi:hypothetical protein